MRKKKPLLILAGNGAYENRGCEAIVRGTVTILREFFNEPDFIVMSLFNTEEQYRDQVRKETDPTISHKKICICREKYSLKWWVQVFLRIFFPAIYRKIIFREIDQHIDSAVAVLSVGGDNYSLDYGKPSIFVALDKFVRSRKKPLVIWGASVGPFSALPRYEKFMIKHLRMVDAIYARETGTVNYLESKGLTDNVKKVIDPAFLLGSKKPEKLGFGVEVLEKAIGINISPLYARYVTGGDEDKLVKLSSKLIENIYAKFRKNIVLVYHVTSSHSDDFTLLKKVYESSMKCCDGRLFLLPKHYCASELKWIIGKMEVFIGCRMHSVIAGLSSGVPALSLSYSLKSKGIYCDIFGNSDFCLNPQDFSSLKIVPALAEMYGQHEKVKKILNKLSKSFKKEAFGAGALLKTLVARDNDNVEA